MSDTPIDTDLTTRKTVRIPEFLDDRIDAFVDDYNAVLAETDMDATDRSQFELNGDSDAIRRLLDIGLAHWQSHGTPFGFTFDPDDAGADNEVLACPACNETAPSSFRVGAVQTDEGLAFESVRCLDCGEVTSLDQAGKVTLF